ncbi:tubulin-like doman-containing protein [Crocosphaera sp. XPORK-15E]|uniref:tubulin-like doman-containing protein n=1 Tax=Crocosphaera sp. XPORK-15E TaxID=3110247 RepID=UPI002B1F1D38|nr:tubulin-like doman-containing protein [Crocosphaera sp. XPORK-15E]MEA5533528.1 tubulin-like doman-containing protein [Crocosphaera sp. XPORK-15E]
MAAVEEKSMVPTILVGVGGTGAEILSRIRRLVEETYGSLENFPILSFLVVDTDKDYKINNPEAGGSPFKDHEKHWASVSGKQVSSMVSSMEQYPWIDSWFPRELERNITSLEAGAGQIRACGRFALFCNYHDIRDKFLAATNRVKGRENFMLNNYGIKVSTNAINVFITGSLSGGTGSGMLIDMGYCVRKWLEGEGSPLVTAIVPMPQAFAGIKVGDRVLANGYAAMMELSYFSDYRTEYHSQFSKNLADEVRSNRAPFDFTYLVGTKNGESDFKLEQIREMIAQNIFLDLTSDFSPHKRSIRDNIKSAWAQADPGGRGYPKNFMSFGLSTIEIPISQIRNSLCYRLAKDLVNWWLNEDAKLPADSMELIKNDILKRMRLNDVELLTDLGAAQDKSYLEEVSQWINKLRQTINQENYLQCTAKGINIFGKEQGKIKELEQFIQEEVNTYRQDHFRELSPDERLHGDYFQRIYDNRDRIISQGRTSLETELYRILEDRNYGTKFAQTFITIVRQIFDDIRQRFSQQQDQVWGKRETERQEQYQQALREFSEIKSKYGITKQDRMEVCCDNILTNLEGSLVATIQRKTRAASLIVIDRLKEELDKIERRLNRFQQRLIQTRDHFSQEADHQAESGDVLSINGIKLYERDKLNELYQDLIEQLGADTQGSKSRFEIGLDRVCSTLSEDILKEASPLWKKNRRADEYMRLFDVTQIPEVNQDDLEELIYHDSKIIVVERTPKNSHLYTEMAACDRLFKMFNDESEIVNNIRIAYNKSKPLILMDKAVLSGKDAGFTPATNINVALLGGRNTADPAAQKIIPLLQQFNDIGENSIKPLGDPERHRLVFVQETGGFSLRCIDGMKELRQSYQDWKGDSIEAKRAQLRGEPRDLPIPVHIQKEPPFWDIFPEDPKIFQLVIQARALNILYLSENQATRENTIRYTRPTNIGKENVDIASSWEEASQILEVRACRSDREEIQRQITQQLTKAETPQQKQQLYQQFTTYLENRSLDLEKQGGKDSPEYKREAEIIKQVINDYKLYEAANSDHINQPLKTASVQQNTVENQAVETPPQPPSQGKWYLYKDGQQTGPFSAEQLLNQGLTPQTYVWCAGMEGWKSASDIPELGTLF